MAKTDSFWLGSRAPAHVTRQRVEDDLKFIRAFFRDNDLPGMVLDFGCGPGRISEAFDEDLYIGIDLRPGFIEEAKLKHPGRTFYNIGEPVQSQIDVLFAFTVFLHLEADTIEAAIKRFDPSSIVVSEIMDPEMWRGDSHPDHFPAGYCRDITDFDKIFDGYVRIGEDHRLFRRYKGKMFTIAAWKKKEGE